VKRVQGEVVYPLVQGRRKFASTETSSGVPGLSKTITDKVNYCQSERELLRIDQLPDIPEGHDAY
jgi:hypothetical protein